jgi:hypothetical protein
MTSVINAPEGRWHTTAPSRHRETRPPGTLRNRHHASTSVTTIRVIPIGTPPSIVRRTETVWVGMERMGFEPTTPGLQSRCSPN